MKQIPIAIIILTLIPLASAATIHGTVFDISLEQVPARVSIFEPNQQIITENGDFQFEVEKGTYRIIAEQLEFGKVIASTEEEITLSSTGKFRLDLILLPSFEQEEDLMASALTPEDNQNQTHINLPLVLISTIGSIIIILLIFIILKLKKQKKEVETGDKKEKPEKQIVPKAAKDPTLPKDLQHIINFLSKQDGRATQKEIRKQFPLSEAKISLMVTDLESRNLVKKVKKGRGNIIILEQAQKN
jgi:uncharacterized membrane protein